MVLRNFIDLEDGKPARLHFTSHRFEDRPITDPITQEGKVVRALVFQVDRLNLVPVNSTFSIVQEKLAQMLAPYLDGARYLQTDFVITRYGRGFRATFSVQPILRG